MNVANIHVSGPIKWDTDGERVPELPSGTIIAVKYDDISELTQQTNIADALSDKYGWCVDSVGEWDIL